MNNIKCCIMIELTFNKASKSNLCDICHYWYFLNKEFKFRPYI